MNTMTTWREKHEIEQKIIANEINERSVEEERETAGIFDAAKKMQKKIQTTNPRSSARMHAFPSLAIH